MIKIALYDGNTVLHSASVYGSRAVIRFGGIGDQQRTVSFISEVGMSGLEMKELSDFLLRIRNAQR